MIYLDFFKILNSFMLKRINFENISSENYQDNNLFHFVAFFHVPSLLSTGVDNEKVRADNEKALELTNSTVFHRGRQ